MMPIANLCIISVNNYAVLLTNYNNKKKSEEDGVGLVPPLLKQSSADLCMLLDLWEFDKPYDIYSKLLDTELPICVTCYSPKVYK
jgi:hypothetical protein